MGLLHKWRRPDNPKGIISATKRVRVVADKEQLNP
jgi:hypothetical protein